MTDNQTQPPYARLNYRPPEQPTMPPEPLKQPDWHIIARNYKWMAETLRWQHDETGLNKETYSPELTEALGQLEALREWERQDKDVQDNQLR